MHVLQEALHETPVETGVVEPKLTAYEKID